MKGGFQCRKSDGHPSAEMLWHGLQKLDVAIEMVIIDRPNECSAMRWEYPPWYLHPDIEPDTG